MSIREALNRILQMGWVLRLVAVLFIAVAAAGGCERLIDMLGLPHDSKAEKVAEIVIDALTGVDEDITPSSREK